VPPLNFLILLCDLKRKQKTFIPYLRNHGNRPLSELAGFFILSCLNDIFRAGEETKKNKISTRKGDSR